MNRGRMTDLTSSWEGYIVLLMLNICYNIINSCDA